MSPAGFPAKEKSKADRYLKQTLRLGSFSLKSLIFKAGLYFWEEWQYTPFDLLTEKKRKKAIREFFLHWRQNLKPSESPLLINYCNEYRRFHTALRRL